MDLRLSPIAGRWYPSGAVRLAETVDQYLDSAQIEAMPGEVVAMVVPHAGLPYSGPVAAYAYRTLRGASFELVAILCPSHYHDDGALITTEHAAYATPLGEVRVDHEALGVLQMALPDEPIVEIRGDREHAIEIELPFLQRTLAPGFSLLPLMLRDQSEGLARALGEAMARALQERRALVVASSDLSHYYPQAAARELDTEMLKQIEAFDPAGVLEAQESGRGFACGYGAIAAGLWAARALGATHSRVVRYATSGDVTGDHSSVVGYGAAVMWKDEPGASAATASPAGKGDLI